MVDALNKAGYKGGLALRNRKHLQYPSAPGKHIGYEKWHIAADKHMVKYIKSRGKKLTETDLLHEIHKYYQRPELQSRIPGVDLGF